MLSADKLAELVVSVSTAEASGSFHVQLAVPGHEVHLLGPYPNPAVARERANSLRRFIVEVVQYWESQTARRDSQG